MHSEPVNPLGVFVTKQINKNNSFSFWWLLPHAVRSSWCLGLATALTLTGAWSINSGKVTAQIVPDASLGRESSRVGTPLNSLIHQIDGGAVRGTNLFHSFEQFSIPTGQTAFFNNNLSIQNIFTHVTGGGISNIDGILKANGTANLFFLNPNGIIFGPHAQLNIGGSFLGTTASNILFADGTNFSGINPQTPPLLEVSVPVGLGFADNPRAIRVTGTGHSLTVSDATFSPIIGAGNGTGLRVLPGKTLALVGGDVFLAGGMLTAPSGRIELGAVAGGNVTLNPNSSGWNLGYNGVPGFGNIQLISKAAVDASGSNGSGSITFQGGTVGISDGSVVLIQNQGISPGGRLTVNASESLEVSGTSPDGKINSRITTEALGTGKGGDIEIATNNLMIQDGAEVSSRTTSSATGGSLNVNASNSIQLLGFSHINPLFSTRLAARNFGSGTGGDITISTRQLTIVDGAAVAATIYGNGNGGNITVNASQSIQLLGVNPNFILPSVIGATSFHAGNAGKLVINTSSLTLQAGGRVDSSAFATGNAGSVIINATDSVDVSGTVPNSVNPSLVDSAALIVDKVTQQRFRLPPVPSGASGDLTINTGRLRVTNGGLVSVRNDGSGNAGSMRVNAGSILLKNGGIQAATTFGEGGNISLTAQQLQLRDNSAITSTAGGTGNGGNLNLNLATLVALENSNITANAVRGKGGNIEINSQGIFLAPNSKITATSQFGVNGVVQVTNLGVDITNSLTPVTNNFLRTEQVVAGSCLARRNVEQGKFIITGTGGLPINPFDAIPGRYVLISLSPLRERVNTKTSPSPSSSAPWKIGDAIVEATSIVRTVDGRILLAALPNKVSEANALVCYPGENIPN